MLAAAVITAAAAVTPVLANLGFGGGDDGLVLGTWDNAVVLFDDAGESATVVLVYDAGARDRARRIEIEQQEAPGVRLTVGLMLERHEDDGGLFDPIRNINCVKARVSGLRPPGAGGVPVIDRDTSEIEGRPAECRVRAAAAERVPHNRGRRIGQLS